MRTLLALVPVAASSLLVALFVRRAEPWRSSVLHAAIVWGVTVTALTEAQSLVGLVSFRAVLTGWVAVVALLVIVSPRIERAEPRASRPEGAALGPRSRLLLLSVAVLAAIEGVTAVVAPPNTFDSMTYHMSRVMHWIQNGSLASYPTQIARQLYPPPWAELAILQFQILSGGDRFANLVQWISMIGSLVGVSLIAQHLGGDRRCQLLAVLVAATIPMGILQASGTQTDYVVSFWLVCFVHQMLALDEPRGRSAHWMRLSLTGASLGLAMLAKATAYVYALPLVAWMVVRQARRWRAGSIPRIALVLAVAAALNTGYYARNIALFSAPLGPGRDGEFVYRNTELRPSGFLSNVVRNAALHAGTPSRTVNAALERSIARLHDVMGVDLDDPHTTWRKEAFHVSPPRLSEDSAGNPLHLALIALSGAGLAAVTRLRRRRELALYGAALTAGFLLFCLYLKWQPWHSRLHLPLFVLWSPAVAIVLAEWRKAAPVVAVTLAVAAIPFALWNGARPLAGSRSIFGQSRMERYFVNQPALREPYTAAMRFLGERGCAEVGLAIGQDGWEYPLWVLAPRFGLGGVRFEHIRVSNESAVMASRAPFAGFSPCALIALHAEQYREGTHNGRLYRSALVARPVSVFLRQ